MCTKIIEQGFEMAIFKAGVTQFFGTTQNTKSELLKYFTKKI